MKQINFIQKIINKVILHIDTYFPDYQACDEKDFQLVQPPRFLVTAYTSGIRPRIQHAGVFLDASFNILFDPGVDVENPKALCSEVALTLMLALQAIPADGYNFRADDIRSEYREETGTLHIFFDIKDFALIDEKVYEDIPIIQDVTYETEVKSG